MQKKTTILIAILALIVGGGLGFGGNYLLSQSSKSTDDNPALANDNQQSNGNTAATEKAENQQSLKLIKELERELRQERRPDPNLPSTFYYYPWNVNFDSGVYKVADGSHYISDEGFGLRQEKEHSTADIRTDLAKIISFLKSKGLEQETKTGSEADGEQVFYIFKSDKVSCFISGYFSFRENADSGYKGRTDLGCTDIDYLKQLEEMQKPLWQAYAAYVKKQAAGQSDANQSSDTRTVFSVSKASLRDSGTEGYKLIDGGVSGTVGPGGAFIIFYQKPDQTWHVATAGQQEESCERLTEEAKTALKGSGIGCYEGDKHIKF